MRSGRERPSHAEPHFDYLMSIGMRKEEKPRLRARVRRENREVPAVKVGRESSKYFILPTVGFSK